MAVVAVLETVAVVSALRAVTGVMVLPEDSPVVAAVRVAARIRTTAARELTVLALAAGPVWFGFFTGRGKLDVYCET